MKGIKYMIALLIVSISSCENDEQIAFNEASESFVRFHLQVNSNNEVIEAPVLVNNEASVSVYKKDNYQTLKIPVALSAILEDNVIVDFTSAITGLNNVSISPATNIEFTPEKLIDTIYIKFNERWNMEDNPEIKLKLSEVSDSNIAIGYANTEVSNDELTISFADFVTTYEFSSTLEEVSGNIGEQVLIDVNFANGFVLSEIEGINLLDETSSNFNYTIEQLPRESDVTISYLLTLEEDVSESLQELETVFNLVTLENYELIGSNEITIRKSGLNSSDNSVFTASNFYNLSDSFYRTYGEQWLYDSNDEQCEWSSFTAFTKPVEVEATHPNAILFSDEGTIDTSDDIYHHAFRIGFVSPTTITTNPFNLKRWVNNESISIANSPGFEIDEALAFFPDDGTSETSGIVEVIKQDLLITNTSGDSYTISISGSGTYSLLDSGVFEIILVFDVANEGLWGGTQTGYYKIYNSNTYPEPTEILSTDCVTAVDL